MEQQVELERYLDGQHVEGQDDGEGAFTLDPRRAAEKLGKFQLTTKGLYLVKAVQSAVMAGAESVTIKVSRRALSLQFDCAPDQLEALSPHKLSESLLALQSLSPSPLRHLVAAVSSARGAGVHSIAWSTPSGSLRVSESGVEIAAEAHPGCRLTVEKKSKLLSWMRGTVFVDEIKAVSERCGWGACRVVLDGRPLESKGWDVFSSGRCDCLGLWPTGAGNYWEFLKKNLLEHRVGVQGAVLAKDPDADHYQAVDGTDVLLQREEHRQDLTPWLLCSPAETAHGFTAALALTPDLAGPARVAFIQHGALLKLSELPGWGHPGALVLLDAADLATDLTEFGLVENAFYQDRIQALEKLVFQTAEGLNESALDSLLQAGGLSEERRRQASGTWLHWLQHHRLRQDTTPAELVQAFLGAHTVSRQPIPEALEKLVRSTHAKHLPSGEPIIAAYSDGLLSDSSDGFVATAHRLCWKSTFMEANYVLWEDVAGIKCTLKEKSLSIGGSDPSTTLNPHLARCLWGLLRAVGELPETEKSELAAFRGRAVRALGKPGKLYYYPHIPLDKLTVAGASFGQGVESDEPVALLYDNTLFGKCDNGVLLTLKRICWCNLLEEPVSLMWSELAPSDLSKVDMGITFKDKQLNLNSAEVRDGLFEVILELLGHIR